MGDTREQTSANRRIVLYTVAADGLGDYAAALKAIPLLTSKNHDLSIHLIEWTGFTHILLHYVQAIKV